MGWKGPWTTSMGGSNPSKAMVLLLSRCRGGDDHYVIAVRARARLILIPDPIQGLPSGQREENTKSTSSWLLLAYLPVSGAQHRGARPGVQPCPSSCCVSFPMLEAVAGEPWTGIRKPSFSLAVALTRELGKAVAQSPQWSNEWG